jgi:hypothetical protein
VSLANPASGAASGWAPPPDVPAELLFAALVDPSPSAPIAYRIAGLEDVPLTVRALSPGAYAAARWASEGLAGAAGLAPEVRRRRYAREVLARCLYQGEGPAEDQERAFASAADVGALSAVELADLASAALAVLRTINPTYARSDWQAWTSRLELGAKHAENASLAIALAGCADYGHGAVVYRPEWHWGIPRGQLLDGHWMAYRAARAAWVDDDTPRPGVSRPGQGAGAAGRGGRIQMVVGADGKLVPGG